MTFPKLLKKTWYKTTLLDTAFFFGFFIVLYLIRTGVQQVLANVQAATPSLTALQQTLEQSQTPENVAKLQQLVSNLNTQTQLALILITVVLPLCIFILWTVISTLQYGVLTRKKITWKLLLKYLLYTSPFFILGVLMVVRLSNLLGPLQELPSVIAYSFELITYPLILGAFFSILTLSYIYLREQTVWKTFMIAIKMFFKKIYYTLPLLIAMGICYVITMFYFFQAYLTKISFNELQINFVGIILGILLLGFFRSLLVFLLWHNQKNYK